MGKYLYSVERAEFALLNADGSYPTPVDWTHTRKSDGATISHKGGLVGGVGPFDLSTAALTLTLTKGKATVAKTISLTGAISESAVTVDELVTAINAAFQADANITASKTTVGADYNSAFIKIVDTASSPLPWYAPFGFTGEIADIVGIKGWKATDELKSSNASPETETGETVTATSGKGNRCVIKEEDAVTSMSLEIALAAHEEDILADVLGDDYDPSTGESFMKGLNDASPAFAYRYWVRKYAAGTNTKSSNDEMLLVSYPSCQATIGDESSEEATFANGQLAASATENARSLLPIKHKKTISAANYAAYVA